MIFVQNLHSFFLFLEVQIKTIGILWTIRHNLVWAQLKEEQNDYTYKTSVVGTGIQESFWDKGDAGPRTSTGDSLSSTSENIYTSLSVTEGISGPFLQKKVRGRGDEGM